MIKRVFVEKGEGFHTQAQELASDFKHLLGIEGLEKVRYFIRYDFTGVPEALTQRVTDTVFSEPNIDIVYTQQEFDEQTSDDTVFAVEFLAGQFDQHADSAAQCTALITGVRPTIRVAKVLALTGTLSPEELKAVKAYMINPVESHEAALTMPDTLAPAAKVPADIVRLSAFNELTPEEVEAFRQDGGYAMSKADMRFVQEYFRDEEKRAPSLTELRVIDTYWSDHCRHTTFQTQLQDIQFNEDTALEQQAYAHYLDLRNEVYGADTQRPVTLMDLAVIGAKALKKRGLLEDLDESEEINACSVKITVDHDGNAEDWLLMFKNETHNHPTEIEPFGGAATCLGGAIRDPLSGRSYVYQAMRLTGAWDPRVPQKDTLPGKLSQRKISKGAAAGYSSYGNQIGLATGQVTEIYDPGFLAKRLEVGAVIAAVPAENVIRERPEPEDVIILVGGRTGRDGCGGATGSSKAHTHESIETSGAEVQKGNPVEERKIQRLFRDPELARMIIRCNDFGAGGVSVAIGELAESLQVDLDKVQKKYEGLDGTELAISESQERMAVVVKPENVQKFIDKASEENLEATPVAVVTNDGRLKMDWRGDRIIDLSRAFLDTNGADQFADAVVLTPTIQPDTLSSESFTSAIKEKLTSLGGLSQKGLGEMFDSTIGAGTVLAPYGGTYALTPQNGMAAKIPMQTGDTTTVSVMTYGYAPNTAKASPYKGGVEAVVQALSKTAALGADPSKVRLSFQEYFERLGDDPKKWGRPFGALLGALEAQTELGVPAIGGKDSMSGTFEDLSVPPTIIAFAVAPEDINHILSAELKASGNGLYYYDVPVLENGKTDYKALKEMYAAFLKLAKTGAVKSAKTVEEGGIAHTAALMSFGNKLGVQFEALPLAELFKIRHGGILFESTAEPEGALKVGETTTTPALLYKEESAALDSLIEDWESALRDVYPEKADAEEPVEDIMYTAGPSIVYSGESFAKPRVLIPAFPGTNCEIDSARAFERAGAVPEIVVFRNQTKQDIEDSVAQIADGIRRSQIVMLPGGFSAGDQPDGSGKFIAAVFRNPAIAEALTQLLDDRQGLMLGICNGFQALIKLGLVPYGKITDLKPGMPTLARNTIGRHVSCIPLTKVVSNKSPWLAGTQPGDMFRIPMSHGEGRFAADEAVMRELIAGGQVATQYVNLQGHATMDGNMNPNGSTYAVEGITSADGRILGKMGHSERIGQGLYKNIPGNTDQKIFESGVKYFK